MEFIHQVRWLLYIILVWPLWGHRKAHKLHHRHGHLMEGYHWWNGEGWD